MVAIRYTELKSVLPLLISQPELWKYCSAAFHVYGKEDALLSRATLLNEIIGDRKEFLSSTTSEQDIKMIQKHGRTGRSLGSDGLVSRLEKPTGRLLKPKRPSRKPKKDKKYVWCPSIPFAKFID